MKQKRLGALICCAANGVMRVERVKKFIDVLAKMGYNLLELAIDDIYKIKSEPFFGYLRGGYTHEEIREMDDYAYEHGIELVPCIQTLAHLTNLVKLPHYAPIVDVNDVLLADEPKTYELNVNVLGDTAYGHGGGDVGMMEALLDFYNGNSSLNTTIAESMQSHYMGFVAEKSRRESGKLISLMM